MVRYPKRVIGSRDNTSFRSDGVGEEEEGEEVEEGSDNVDAV